MIEPLSRAEARLLKHMFLHGLYAGEKHVDALRIEYALFTAAGHSTDQLKNTDFIALTPECAPLIAGLRQFVDYLKNDRLRVLWETLRDAENFRRPTLENPFTEADRTFLVEKTGADDAAVKQARKDFFAYHLAGDINFSLECNEEDNAPLSIWITDGMKFILGLSHTPEEAFLHFAARALPPGEEKTYGQALEEDYRHLRSCIDNKRELLAELLAPVSDAPLSQSEEKLLQAVCAAPRVYYPSVMAADIRQAFTSHRVRLRRFANILQRGYPRLTEVLNNGKAVFPLLPSGRKWNATSLENGARVDFHMKYAEQCLARTCCPDSWCIELGENPAVDRIVNRTLAPSNLSATEKFFQLASNVYYDHHGGKDTFADRLERDLNFFAQEESSRKIHTETFRELILPETLTEPEKRLLAAVRNGDYDDLLNGYEVRTAAEASEEQAGFVRLFRDFAGNLVNLYQPLEKIIREPFPSLAPTSVENMRSIVATGLEQTPPDVLYKYLRDKIQDILNLDGSGWVVEHSNEARVYSPELLRRIRDAESPRDACLLVLSDRRFADDIRDVASRIESRDIRYELEDAVTPSKEERGFHL